MRPIVHFTGLPLALSLLLLVGCAPAPTPAAAPAAAASPEPTAAPRAVAPIDGVARYFGQPLADAEVHVVPFGGEAVATVRADGEGRFAFELPAAVATGAMLKLVARKDGVTVVTVAKAPERRLLQAEGAALVIIDEHRSLAFYVLAPRLEAISMLAGQNAGAGLLSEAVKAYDAAVGAMAANPAPLSRSALERLTGTVRPEGRVEATPAVVAALVEVVPPAAVPSLMQQATALGELIRLEVTQKGATRPPADLIREVPLTKSPASNQVVPSVFDDSGASAPASGSSGSSGRRAPSTSTAQGSVAIAPGEVEDTTAAPTMILE